MTLSVAYAPGRGRSPRVAPPVAYVHRELQVDCGIGVAVLQAAGATDGVTRLGRGKPR